MKPFLLLFVFLSLLHSKEITVETTGEFRQKGLLGVPTPAMTAKAREAAIANAKAAAAEEATTLVFSQSSSKMDSTGLNDVKRNIVTLSAAEISSEVLSAGWEGDTYRVKLKCRLNSASMSEIIDKQMDKLKRVETMQKNNEKILAELNRLNTELGKVVLEYDRNDIKSEPSPKVQAIRMRQANLIGQYTDNSNLLGAEFTKGSLLAKAKARENGMAAGKQKINTYLFEYFSHHIKLDVGNIESEPDARHPGKYRIRFDVIMQKPDFNLIMEGLGEYFTKDDILFSRTFVDHHELTAKENTLGRMLVEWVEQNGPLCLTVSVGNRSICLQESIYGRGVEDEDDVPTILVARQYRNEKKAVIDNIPESVMRESSRIDVRFERKPRLYNCRPITF